MLLAVENLKFKYTDKPLLDDVSLYINEGEKIGLIGVNGSGKSTLIDFLINKPSYRHKEMKLGFLPQNPKFTHQSILEFVSEGIEEDKVHEAKAILTKLKITDFSLNPNHLSGGEKKRVAIAKALVSDNNLLILDEPTNHLDLDMISWLEKYLQKYKGALLLVTHDRYFLERITNRIVELDNGKLYSYVGNYDKYLELRQERIEIDKRVNEKKKAFLKKEIEWVRSGVLARGTKSKSRLDKYYEISDSVTNLSESKLVIDSNHQFLSRKTIECKNVSYAIDNRVLFSNLNYILLRDDRLGILGVNGAGKTSLLKVLVGLNEPTKGEVIIGETAKIGYFSQELSHMDTEMKVIEYINEHRDYQNASNMLEDFLFPRDIQQTQIKRLSGGEKRRLELLRILIDNPNILILDEPTNDLDVQTLIVLENYLETFKGAVIIVSHDRYFLDKVCEHVFVLADQKIMDFPGGYSSYKKISEFDTKQVKVVKEKAHEEKLSYKEKIEFEALDKRINEIEERLKNILKEQLDNPTDYFLISDLEKEKNAIEIELETKTERYLELLEKS